MNERAFTLQTDRFNVSTPELGFINPRCFGRDFAAWLKERLQERSLNPSDPIQEDFGWVLRVPYQRHNFTVSVGVMDDSIGRTPAEWRVGVSGEGLFTHAAALTELAGILKGALTSEPHISLLGSA
jgi:hypothetical protein